MFALLLDLGFDLSTPPAPEAAAHTGPSTIEQQTVVQTQPTGEVTLNLGVLLHEVGRRGALGDLGALLFDVSPEQASAEITADEVLDALPFYFVKSTALIEALRDFVRNLA